MLFHVVPTSISVWVLGLLSALLWPRVSSLVYFSSSALASFLPASLEKGSVSSFSCSLSLHLVGCPDCSVRLSKGLWLVVRTEADRVKYLYLGKSDQWNTSIRANDKAWPWAPQLSSFGLSKRPWSYIWPEWLAQWVSPHLALVPILHPMLGIGGEALLGSCIVLWTRHTLS